MPRIPKTDMLIVSVEQNHMHADSQAINLARDVELAKLRALDSTITRLTSQLEEARRERKITEANITGMTNVLAKRY